MQHYRISVFDYDKINKHPKNEVVCRDEPFHRWRFEGDFVRMYNVILDLLKTPTNINDGIITTKYKFTASQLSVLYYYGISVTEYSPEREYTNELIDELTEHLTTCIKNRYNVVDKLYSFIKELEK